MFILTPNLCHYAIREYVSFCMRRVYNSQAVIEDYLSRPTDLLISKGYDEDRYATGLFCIKGSPNKFYGTISIIDECKVLINANYGKKTFKIPDVFYIEDK